MATYFEFGAGIKQYVEDHPTIDCGQAETAEITFIGDIGGQSTVKVEQKTTTGRFYYDKSAADAGNPAVSFFLTPSTK